MIVIPVSLLPALRGAAPIQASILQGHSETGITIMQMVPALDAGPMLHTLRTNIASDETYGELHDRMAELGALGIVQALALMEAGVAHAIAQDDSQATYAAKITRELARLDWRQSAQTVSRSVRAFDPRPGAYTTLRDTDVKLYGASVVGGGDDESLDEALRASSPGTVRTIDADGMIVRCGKGAVRVREVQPAGKPRLTPQVWSRGRGITVGDWFA